MRNLKKVISSVAAIAIVASSASAFAVTFPDVDSSASYANAVETLTALKIVNGDDKGLFNPDNNVTRAEFTKMAVGALGETAAAEAQTGSQFTDAANTSQHWAAGFIAQGVADGFINGMGDGTFAPDAQVTYAQASKMLVAAVGYTTYAEAAGGWPSGYVSQASSLGITKGVSATNDTALTRAQCAIMIYNAMQVPLCVIDSWETQTTLTGTVQTPVLKKLDGKEGRDYQDLLSDKHDAYAVKGRVTVTPQGNASGLKKDEVKYRVEVSDNFDDVEYGGSVGWNTVNGAIERRTTETFKVGDTDAINMLFSYTSAIVQKDEDSGEYTILSIENFGNSKEIEVATDDVADDADALIKKIQKDGKDFYTGYVENKKLPVFKSSTTSTTTKYDLSVDDAKNVNAVMYVNGVEAGVVTDDLINEYIINNPTGSVKLVDQTTVGSTTTDGKYDFIMVSYYVDAVVDYVNVTGSKARIYFKHKQTSANRMEWDLDNEDVDITFTKDGNKIEYTDLAEYDVLSIMYDILTEKTGTGSLTDKEYYNVLVSSNTVEGNVTSSDPEDNTVTIGGTEYDLVDGMQTADVDFELGTQYQVYIDAFGYIAYSDEGTSEKNYGVIVASYQGSGDDYPTVRLITSDAKVVAYECKDMTEARKFYNYALSQNENGTAEWQAFTKSTGLVENKDSQGKIISYTRTGINKNICEGKTVCTYKLSGGKLKFDKKYTGSGESQVLEYKANSQKLGTYSINESTKIIDMDEYMSEKNSGSSVNTLSVSDFEDEAEYEAVLFDRNNDSIFRFAIVFKGTSSIRPESQIAIIQKSNGQEDTEAAVTCDSYVIARGGTADQKLLIEHQDGVANLKEGTIVAYTTNSDGYVERQNLYILFNADGYADYKTLLETTYAQANFVDILNGGVLSATIDGTSLRQKSFDNGARAIKYESVSNSKEVLAYFGIVYKKGASNVELLTKQASGISKVAEITDFALGGANVYVYDYNERDSKGVRVSTGNSGTQSQNIFKNALNGVDKTDLSWATVKTDDIRPQLAFIKEVDGDVTDALFFLAP